MCILIRPVAAHELATLRELARRTFFETFAAVNTVENMDLYAQKAFTAEQTAREHGAAQSSFFFATHKQEIAGYLKLNTGEAQTDTLLDNALEIERIYIMQNFQGKYLGKALFNHAR